MYEYIGIQLGAHPILHINRIRVKVGSKMAIAASAPVLPIQKKQCCKIARFTDASCITFTNRNL
jgi:hypothetical protein